MRFRFDIQWQLQSNDRVLGVPAKLLELLEAISGGENLRQAAKSINVSYRSAWGVIGEWETTFATPLVISARGRGTKLTPFAAALLETRTEIDAQFRDALAGAAEAASGHLTRMSTAETSALRIVSSDHIAINQLANKLREVPARRIVLDIIGSESALRRYQRPDADVVGFHIPVGRQFSRLSEHLINLLDAKRDEIYQLEARELGLIHRVGIEIESLSDLMNDPKSRFINRQSGSTTRLVLDALLGDAGIPPGTISGYADEEHTHTAVAARIASGDRDVGFAERRVAEQFSLNFVPLVTEKFYICWKAELQPEIKSEILECLRANPNLDCASVTLVAVQKMHGLTA